MQGPSLWHLYGWHRQQVHAAIDATANDADAAIALVGAGRCDDADLARLKARFSTVMLVDIDRHAVLEGLAGQGLGETDIVCIAPFDVTGVANGWPRDTGERAVEAWLERLARPPALPFSRPLDGIVSQALLSQLVLDVIERLGLDHVRLQETVGAVRTAHLRFLLQSVRPGGWALLVGDVVASDTLPMLLNASMTRRSLARIMAEAVAAGNFFTGLTPAHIRSSCETDPWLMAEIVGIEEHGPWIWRDLPGHARLVYAMALRRTAVEAA